LGVSALLTLLVTGWFQLHEVRDEKAIHHAALIAKIIATQMRTNSPEDRPHVLQTIAKQARVEALLVTHPGRVLAASNLVEPLPVSTLLQRGHGIHFAAEKSVAFATYTMEPPYGNLTVIVLETHAMAPLSLLMFVMTTGVPSFLLLAITVSACVVLTRRMGHDVTAIHGGMVEAARPQETTSLLPVRFPFFDRIGLLAVELNALLERLATARKNYQLAMARADVIDRSRARFLEALSHELRTPLNGILGFADLLLTEVEGPLPF